MNRIKTRLHFVAAAAVLCLCASQAAAQAPVLNSQPASSAVCAGTNGTTFSVTATGATSYQWQVSPTGIGGTYTNITNGGIYSNAQTAALTITNAPSTLYGAAYRVAVTNGNGTVNSNAALLTFVTTWTGSASTAWSAGSNWSCGVVPDSTIDVVITTASNQPLITTASQARNITINSGASLTIAGSTSLMLAGTIVNSGGTFNASGTNATVIFASTRPNQAIPGGTYYNLQFNGSGNKVLTGDITVANNANIVSNNKVFLGAYTITFNSTASLSSGSAARYFVSNGTGGLKKLGLAGSFTYHMGTAVSYTPFLVNNSGGTVDNFTGRIGDSVYESYTNDAPQGAVITSRVVNKTWYVTEDVPGGSNAQMIVQWNQSDELPSFVRTGISFAHYVGGRWVSSASQSATAAAGPGPYLATLNNITSFSPFGLGSAGSLLPVVLQKFEGTRRGQVVSLEWTVGSETNTVRYEVERSRDGRDFSTIGAVPALQASSYNFADPAAPAAGDWYYRLRVIGAGEAPVYSNTVKIAGSRDVPETVVTLAENPMGDALALDVTNATTAEATVSVRDLNGKTLLSVPVAVQPGRQAVRIPVSDLPAGAVYLIGVRLGGDFYELKAVR